jgi:hypothetical protein
MRLNRVIAALCLSFLMVVSSSQTQPRKGSPLIIESRPIRSRPHVKTDLERARDLGNPLPPTSEEFSAAKSLVIASLGPSSVLYNVVRAMPGIQPVETIEQANTTGLADHWVAETDRVLSIALKPRPGTSRRPEIVGADLTSKQVVHYRFNAPPTAIATADDAEAANPHLTFARGEHAFASCGLPDGGDSPTLSDASDEVNITVKSADGSPLWQFEVHRPSASDGYWGSGIELWNVNYKGVRVLKRASVPILNVQYFQNKCGPYRDWQNEEYTFQADVNKVLSGDDGSGIATTTDMPQTILQTGNDSGNFYGVAMYTGPDQTVTLMSEMAAGWYRYMSEWTFSPDGSISPRWGFGAIDDACVCHLHFHHAYWRLEFDLGGNPAAPNTRVVNQFEKTVNGVWTPSTLQETFFRDPKAQYRVVGANGLAYQIIPGDHDGSAAVPKQTGDTYDVYGKSDIWVLNAKDKNKQYDDHGLKSEGKAIDPNTSIRISQFLKTNATDTQNAPLDNQSVVVWYGAHFTHDQHGEGPNPEPEGPDGDHIVGPVLRPMQ